MDDLRKVQLYLLDEVVEVFEKNNVDYFLDAGTLLGAVRHKGFIPWDDDIDIVIHIDDFSRAITALKTSLPTDMKLNEKELSLNKISGTPIKIEYKYSEIKEIMVGESQGIFIDLFVFSPMNPNFINSFRGKIFGKPIVASRINYFKNNNYRKDSSFIVVFLMELFKMIPDSYIQKIVNTLRERFKNEQFIAADYKTWAYVKDVHPIEKIYPLTTLAFEGVEYKVPKDTDDYLKIKYGDYMQLPPEDQRQGHHIVEYTIDKMPTNKKRPE